MGGQIRQLKRYIMQRKEQQYVEEKKENKGIRRK
jgi:hypothetical protein